MADKPVISNDKYESTGETKVRFGITLHRIRAKVAIGIIAAGTLGGWIEKEANLDVSGNAWVSGNAQVYGNAQVSGNAWVSGNARYLTVSPIGSENGCLTAFVERDGTIRVRRGCFDGTIDQFANAVADTHGDSQHGVVYRLVIEMIRARLDATPVADAPDREAA